MRHRRAKKRLGRNTSNRKALMRSLASNLIIHERITTTLEKAKEASSLADKLIGLGKKNTATAKKTAISILGSKLYINRLFDDIAPRFTTRKGGYTRVLHLGTRKGDGARMALLELTERKIIEKTKSKEQKPKEQRKKPVEQKEEKRPKAPSVEAGEKPEKPKKPTAGEKKKPERKGFFKDLKRYFRRKTG